MKMQNNIIRECFDCGGKSIVDLGDNYCFSNPFYGDLSSGDYHVFKCRDCGMILMDYNAREHLRCEAEGIVQDFLMSVHCPGKCMDEYLNEAEVKTRIGEFNDDLVMHVKIDGEKLYWKPSVEQYAQSNDGRIKIK